MIIAIQQLEVSFFSLDRFELRHIENYNHFSALCCQLSRFIITLTLTSLILHHLLLNLLSLTGTGTHLYHTVCHCIVMKLYKPITRYFMVEFLSGLQLLGKEMDGLQNLRKPSKPHTKYIQNLLFSVRLLYIPKDYQKDIFSADRMIIPNLFEHYIVIILISYFVIRYLLHRQRI